MDKKLLIAILENVSEIKYTKENENELLTFIISNSIKAVTFVTLIEDEFEIEFDDDTINLDFFSSLEYILKLINNVKTVR